MKCFFSATLKSGLLSDKQKDLLQGNGQIIQSVMSYVWTVWEDSTDVRRLYTIRIINKKYHIVWTVLKSNGKIVVTETRFIPLEHIYNDCSLSWLGTGT